MKFLFILLVLLTCVVTNLAVRMNPFLNGRRQKAPKPTPATACSTVKPCPLTGGKEAFNNPPEIQSSNGVLKTTLTVDVSAVKFDWLTLKRRVYNGSIPGPTWKIRRGDVVNITIVNRLQKPEKDEKLNEMRFPNSTNLHTHGLHISSKEDKVFVRIEPGETYTYNYTIDSQNPAGTYWYHPHLHGSTIFQTHSGMAGMIIVEDPVSGSEAMPRGLALASCPQNCQNEVRLVMQPVLEFHDKFFRSFISLQNQINDSIRETPAFEDWLMNSTGGVNLYTTNGKLWPIFTMPEGQIKRFRMVNAGGGASLALKITKRGTDQTAKDCTIMEIAFDGVYLDTARPPRSGRTFLPPSSKADWLVVCNHPGNYELRSVITEEDDGWLKNIEIYSGILLTITISGSTTSYTAIETSLPAREFFVSGFSSISQDLVHGRHAIEVNTGFHLNRNKFSNGTYYRFKSEVGTIQEWYLISTDPEIGHPMHIHVNHFEVVSYNKYTGPVSFPSSSVPLTFFDMQTKERCYHQHAGYDKGQETPFPENATTFLGQHEGWIAGQPGTLGYVEPGEFRDVLFVPPLANITIRFLNHKYTGDVVIHCHFLNHEDLGMMMVSEVVEQNDSLDANEMSGNAYPGQCGKCDPYPFNQDMSNCLGLGKNKWYRSDFAMQALWALVIICVILLLLLLIIILCCCRRYNFKHSLNRSSYGTLS